MPSIVSAASQQVISDSSISNVIVYADRALVTRSVNLNLAPGTNLITFTGLPVTIAEDSIRAEGKGTGKARISGLTVQNAFLDKIQDKKVQELEDEIAKLNQSIAAIDARRAALTSQRSFVDSIRVGWGQRISKDLTSKAPTTAELAELSKFIGNDVYSIEEQKAALEVEKKPLQDKLDAQTDLLNQTLGERKKEVRTVEVAVDAPKAMDFTMNLSYLVNQAIWMPSYDLRLASDGKSAEFVYKGIVQQRSGEDWKGVNLSLSTAAPAVGGAPPEMSPWSVQLYEPPQYYEKSRMRVVKEAPALAAELTEDKDYKNADQAAEVLTAQIREGQTSVLFNIPTPVNVPADGTRKSNVIAIENIPVVAEYFTIPKVSQRVYLRSKVTNTSQYPILPGEANIFNDTAFVGRAQLKGVASGEKFDMFFGADERIKVKRTENRVEKRGGILSNNRVSWVCSIELENYKNENVAVEVQDQMPVSGNKEIKVSLENAGIKPDEIKDDGTIIWKVNLKAGEKLKIPFEIVVEYPKDRQVSGV